jgi:hypothetical protein
MHTMRHASFQEEGEYEYISDHQGGANGKEEAHVEPAILVQPLVSEAQAGEGKQGDPGTVPLCADGATSSCSKDAGGIGHAHGKKLVRALSKDDGSGSVCYGIAAVTTVAGPEVKIPYWLGLVIFGACGG